MPHLSLALLDLVISSESVLTIQRALETPFTVVCIVVPASGGKALIFAGQPQFT